MCGKMAKCDMEEIHSANAFLRVTYFLNGPKGLFEEMIYGMPIQILKYWCTKWLY